MENKFKRFLALMLAVVMVIGMMPHNFAYAEETGNTDTVVDETQASEPQESVPQETELQESEHQESVPETTEAAVAPVEVESVAKVGNTEYTTIDEAIAAWTNGTTLTLLANVTLSDVIKLSSTEYHILDLGTYTMTAASGKDAIQYVVNGRSSADYALDIKADATNPGGITATGKTIVSHIKPSSGAPSKDRPITRFFGGVFNASYVVKQGGSGRFLPGAGYTGASAPYFQFYGGVYNGTIYTNRSQNQFHGGTFNGSMQMSVDSSAYTQIAGGTFKNLSNSMGSELNSDKFVIGTAKGANNGSVCIDENGYYVITTTAPTTAEASVASNYNSNNYFYYSTVNTDGMYYEDVYDALEANPTGTVTVLTEELDLTGSSFTGTIVVPEGETLTITNAPEDLKVEGEGEVIIVKPVAQIGETGYETLEEAFAAAVEGDTIVLLADATPALTSQRAITKAAVIDLGGKTLTLTEDDLYFGTTTFKNGTIIVDSSVKPSTAVFWMFANQTLTFDGVKIVATGVTGTYLIGLDGANADLNLLNGSEIVVENTTALDLDIICVNGADGNDIVINNSKVNVTNLDGRVFFRGNYTVSGSSEIALSGITKAGFRIEAGQTLTIADTATVDIEGEPRDGGIHLTDTTSTYTKADTATVNATVNAPAPVYVARIGETGYETLAAAVAAAKAGDEIVMQADVAEDVTVPAGVTFNGNGKQVGAITAAGEITFKGYTKATNFGVQYTNTTINIVEGACLEITGTGRLVIGHGCTFNITGTITDAKNADKATIQPSLIMPGASFTGAGVTFNVTNAYIKAPSSYCSSSKSASGTFDFNITNSIWESAGKLAFEAQSTAATVNFELKDSVLTTGSHLVFGVSRGEIVIDNSNVNVGTSRQIENQSTMTVKNGSVVNGAVATSSNAKNPGTLIVDNATYAVTGEFSGSDLGTGTLIVKNGASFTAGTITKANITIDATGMKAGDNVDMITANLSKFAGTLEVTNNDGLEAEIVDGKIVLVAGPVAQIGDVKYKTLQDAENAAKDGDTIVLLVDIELDKMVTFFNSASERMVTLDMNGKTITLAANWNSATDKSAFWVCDGLTITGNGTINAAPAGDAWAYAIIVGHRNSGTTEGYSGKLVIENGTFYSEESSVVSVTHGTATINGGTFEAAGDMDLNCIDDMRAAGKASIVVKGGTFVGFNPQNNASEGANTNFVAEGYISEKIGDTYTVREWKDLIIVVSPVATMSTTTVTVATMDEAVAYAQANPTDTVTYQITGPVELTTGFSHGIVDLGKNVTIEGVTSDAKLTIVGGGVPDIKGVTFKNITIADEGTYLPTANEFMYQNFIDCSFVNVTFVDGIRLSGKSTLTNCTVEANTTNEYAIWLDEGEFSMTGSTVTGGADAYGLIKSDEVDSISITDNTFEYLGAANKEALNVKGAKITASDNIFIDCTEGVLPADKTNYAADGTTVITDAEVVGNNEVVTNVAKIGETKYETLAEAIAAWDEGETLTLLANVETSATITITKSKTLDGNGKTLTYIGSNRAIEIPMEANGADVTIKNLTIDASSAERGINYNTNGALTVENVTVTSTTYAINFPTYADNATVSIEDSELTAAIALNIWGSDMEIAVTDSDLYSVENDPNFSYATIQLNCDEENGHIAEGTIVTVTGGKLSAIDQNGVTSIAVSNWTKTGKVTISSTTEVIGEIKYAVATYGGASAYTLQDAVDEVIRMGYTCPIVLIRDIALTENVIIPANANITIDLNGKTLTGPDDGSGNWYAFIVNGGKLTLTDSEGTGELFAKCYGVETKSGEFILDGAKITATNNATLGSAIVNYGGTVTIKSGTISGALSSVFTGGYFSNATTNILGGEFAGDVIVESYADKDFTETVTSNANTYPVGEDYKWVEQNGAYVLTAKTYVAQLGETKYESLAEAFAAAKNGDEVKILVAGTYALSTSGKDITITGAVDGVVFDDIGAKNMGGANVTFNNVTFDYYPNVNYTGLQHSGNLVYNNCTINGQVFLYGTSETFNNCTFNQNSADAYNVWTYGAKEVAFNECTFNSAGKSVLIYSEQSDLVNNVSVTKSTFNASSAVEGKAAIEMDSSLTAGINLTIDADTTATGFGSGNVSGNSLWNNKKGSATEANNDITVVVNNETVLAPYVEVTVTVQDATMVEGNKYPEFSYTTDVAGVPALDITYSVDGTTISATVAEMDGYKFTVIPGTLTVEKALVRAYASNNAKVKYFTNLAEALEYAAAQNDYVPVALLGNITLNETIVFADDKANTIELQGSKTGGNTLTLSSDFDGPMFKIESGRLSIKNLKLNAKGDAFYVTGGALDLNYHSAGSQFVEVTSQTGNCIYIRGGSVNVNGAKLTSLGEYPAIQGNGNYVGNVTLTKWNIGDGTYPVVSAPNSDMAIYWPGNGKLTIEGGEYTGDTAVYAKSGTITINGGTFTADGAKVDYVANSNGATATGDAVVIETSSNPDYETPVVSITGGTFTSANAQPIAVYGAGTEVKKFVYGGTFNKDLDNKIVAEKMATEKTATGVWTIVPGVVYIEKDGEKSYYATVEAAIKAVPKNTTATPTTITLLTDCTTTGPMVGHQYTQNIIFDLNGHTLFCNGIVLTAYRNGTTLTVKNGTIKGNASTGSLRATYGGRIVLGDNLTIQGAGGSAVLIYADNGTVDITAKAGVKFEGGKQDFKQSSNVNNKLNVAAGIGRTYFGTLADAVEAAAADGTIKLMMNETAATVSKAVTIEKNGFTATITAGKGYKVTETDEAYVIGQIDAVAEIDGAQFETLAEAVAAAQTGDIIKLLSDVTMENTVLTINSDVTIDFNGYTVTGNFTEATTAFVHIQGGNVTLKGEGGMKAISAEEILSNLIRVETAAKLVIESGNYYQENSINGNGMIDSRGDEIITIKGGTFTLGNVGTKSNGSPWILNTSGQNTKNIIVEGGTFNADIVHQFYPFEVMTPNNMAMQDNGNGTWTMVEAVAYVTEREWSSAWYTNEVGYATLAEAIAACEGPKTRNGKTSEQEVVVLLSDITLSETLVIPADKTVALDLNGKTISMEDASGKAAQALKNEGNLTIKDSAGNGKITFVSTTPSANYGYSTSTIINIGNLTVDGGTIENTTVGGASYAIDNAWYSQDVSLTVNGGTIRANKIAVRQVPFSTTYKNVVTVTDGTLTGATAGLQVHNFGSTANLSEVKISGGIFDGTYAFYTTYSNAKTATGTNIEISGGTFNGYLFLYNGQNGSSEYPMNVTITNGNFNGGVYVYCKDASGAQVNIPCITGGTFTKDAKDGTDEALLAEGYLFVANENGTYVVEKDPAYGMSVKMGDNYYETLAEALAAAQGGEEIVLIDNITMTDATLTIAKSVTIDFNGKTVTAILGGEAKSEEYNGSLVAAYDQFILVADGASVVMKDSVGNGGLKAQVGEYGTLSNLIRVSSEGELVIESGNYTQNLSVVGAGMIDSRGDDNITIKGGTFILDNVGTQQNGSPWILNTSGRNYRHINVEGGSFNADVAHQYWAFEVDVAEGKAIQKDENGMYHVVDAVANVLERANGYDHSVNYATLEEAFAAASAKGYPVTLLKAVDNIVIPAAFTGELHLGNFTLKSIAAENVANIVIDGNVVVENDNGSAITGVELNISGTGTLTAIANGDHAYGIGGDQTQKITITGITIKDVRGGHVQPLFVNDTKYGKSEPEGGAAIGSGYNGAEITLNGVTIQNAQGGSKAAGIGARFHTGVTINITDCTINNVEGGNASAGIGGSRVSNGAAENGTTINIVNSTITAKGGQAGAGIGSGYDTHCQSSQPLCTINITDSTINATGGKYAAGVGTGFHNAALAYQIKNSTVNAVSGEKFYKDAYTKAQDIGFGVVDPTREGVQIDTSSLKFEVADTDGLKTALESGATNVVVTEGTYTFPASSLKEGVTLNCEEGTVFEGNSSLNVNGATVVGATFSNSTGNAVGGTVNGTFENCEFTGYNALRGCYAGEKVVFKNCVFSGDVYGIHFDGGANEVVFINCTFSGFNAMGAAITKLTMENCTFKANETSNYNGINLWGDTDMINCTFEFEAKVANEWVDLCSENKTVTFTNCKVVNGDETASIATVASKRHDSGKIIIDGFELIADGLLKKDAEYQVFTASGLEKLNAMMVDKTAGKNAVVNLTADIDFTGKTWTPVDSHADTAFSLKEINGNGHTISNLTVNGQAMFKRFAGSGDVVIKDITFDNAVINSNGTINTSILTAQSYQNVLLDNVDVKNSTISGGYKVAPLIATVYNESSSTITATLKNCDVENVTVKATSYDFCTAGMVAFVYADNNDKIEFENCTVTNVKLYAPNDSYKAHAAVYTTGSGSLFNEAEGVTVTNVTFENN